MSRHLLIAASQYLPQIGGMERQMEYIAHEFEQKGWQVDIVVPRRLNSTAAIEKDGAITIRRTFSCPLRFLQSVTEALGALWFCCGKVFRSVDTVHCHNFSCFGMMLIYQAVRKGKTAVITFHSHPHVPHPGTLMHKWMSKVMPKLRVVVISPQIRDAFLEAFPNCAKNVSFVANGVDVERFTVPSPEERIAARRSLKIRDDVFLVSYVGRLSAEKGIDTLLDVCRKLSTSPNVQIAIAGDGPLVDSVVDAAKGIQKILYLGGNQDVKNVYWASDLYLLPSYREGMPVALLEAMACGIPAVVTATAGSTAVIDDQHDGVVVQVGNAAALASAVLSLRDNVTLCHAMGNAAATKIRAHWSGAIEIRRLEDIFIGMAYKDERIN